MLRSQTGTIGVARIATKCGCLCDIISLCAYRWTDFNEIWHGDANWQPRSQRSLKFLTFTSRASGDRNAIGRVRPSTRPFVSTVSLSFESTDLWTLFLKRLWGARSSLGIKSQGHRSSSNVKVNAKMCVTLAYNAACYKYWSMAVVAGFHCDVIRQLRPSAARRAASRTKQRALQAWPVEANEVGLTSILHRRQHPSLRILLIQAWSPRRATAFFAESATTEHFMISATVMWSQVLRR